MNRRILTPLLIAVLGLMTVLPEAPSLLVHAQAVGPAVVAVNPPIAAGDIGGSVSISVDVSNVDNLVGYDVVLNFDPTILSCTAASFPAILPNNFKVGGHNFCSNGTGSAEAASASVGGTSANIGGPTSVMILTFTPLAASFTNLQIALAQLAVLPGPTLAPVTTMDGQFGVPPSLAFIAPNVIVGGTGQHAYHIKLFPRENTVTLVGTVQLLPSNVRAGFGGVLFDVIGPGGVDTPVVSNIGFGFPGDALTVSGTFTFDMQGNAVGAYHVIVTILRCTSADASTCVNGDSASNPNTFWFLKT